MNIKALRFNKDNYAYLITNGTDAAVVDPGNYSDIESELKNFNIKYILLTHRHHDHSGGVNKILGQYPYCKVIDINKETASIFGNELKLIKTPGHTNDSCCFYIPGQKAVFTGDTLFTSCCGRNFEGTYKEMHNSLQKLVNLPKDTKIYPGHEFLEYCINFIDYIGNNSKPYRDLLKNRYPSVKVTIEFEILNNPFLTTSYEEFKTYRELKNRIELN